MSRVGNSPILIPEGVTVDLKPNHIVVKGKLGELDLIFHDIEVTLKEKNIVLSRTFESKLHKSKHGLYRALIANMVTGVNEGFTKELELVGVGYRVKASGKTLDLTLGFSHPIKYELPESVSAETPSQTEIVLKSHDKQVLGQVASEIRAFRPPEPYKGKGVKYSDERIKRKEAKKAAGGA
mgnify:CR=1 FL=1